MSKKQTNIELTGESTIFYREEDDGNWALYANVRQGDVIHKYRLKTTFPERWQAGKTRLVAIEQGALNPEKWELVQEIDTAKGNGNSWTPPAV